MNHSNLWAPWRMAYLRGLVRKVDELGGEGALEEAPAGSFFADYWAHPEHDQANHVIYRDKHGMLLLNKYPYANGHLLVALGEPRPRLLDYESDQRAAFWRLVDIATDVMERAINPQGMNIGINQGDAAGAGVLDHLHAHLVPRWFGDTNFMAVVGNVRVIPDSLEEMAKTYRTCIAHMKLGAD